MSTAVKNNSIFMILKKTIAAPKSFNLPQYSNLFISA